MLTTSGYVARISRSTSNKFNLNDSIMVIDATAHFCLRNGKDIQPLTDVDDFVSPGSARLSSILAQLPTLRRVLELGCGHRPVIAARNALHVAVDHDGRALQTAQIPVASVQPEVALHLLQADVEHLPFRARFDLILARHPDVDRSRDSWYHALTHARDYLAENGVLLVTVYSPLEAELVRSWAIPLKQLSLDWRKISAPAFVGDDRFVMCWQLP